jgi:hypothetical protein
VWLRPVAYAITSAIIVGSVLITARWSFDRWPRLTLGRLSAAYALTIAFELSARVYRPVFPAVLLVWWAALLILACQIGIVVLGGAYGFFTRPAPRTNRDWFEAVCFFLPREVREAFWSDWKQLRRTLIARGYPLAFQWCVFAANIGWEIAAAFKEQIVEAIAASLKPRI